MCVDIGKWVVYKKADAVVMGRVLSYDNMNKEAKIVRTQVLDNSNDWKGQPSEVVSYENIVFASESDIPVK